MRGKAAIPIRPASAEPQFRPTIRSTPRAFICRGEKLLVQEKQHPVKGRYFTLPGGKQEAGETLEDALRRECREEIGAAVTVKQLLHVAEVFRPKSGTNDYQHQLDFVFNCSVPEGYEPVLGCSPDPHQIATCWITPENAQQLRPSYVTKLFSHGCRRDVEIYLGSHNEEQ
ncbi:NUDIX domain-containing protein [uncultured Roseibium sp.]|uniref:NUDIX domain-containing protein n=1 Tax=uncultured Roseibium sp. TaxID=1936171 RepID=UPI00262B54CC|nr:NUDIX domain-containing protein [uncultured Roseibium sp.]